MLVPVVYTDNRESATLTQYPDFHRRMKHIRRKHHFARKCVEAGNVIVKWVAGKMNPADILTKPEIGKWYREVKDLAGVVREGEWSSGLRGSVGAGQSVCNPLQWHNGTGKSSNILYMTTSNRFMHIQPFSDFFSIVNKKKSHYAVSSNRACGLAKF